MIKVLLGLALFFMSYSGFAITNVSLNENVVKQIKMNNDSISIQIELVQKSSGVIKILNFKSIEEVEDFDFGKLGFEKFSKRKVKATIKVSNLTPKMIGEEKNMAGIAASGSLTLPLKKMDTIKKITKILYDTTTGV